MICRIAFLSMIILIVCFLASVDGAIIDRELESLIDSSDCAIAEDCNGEELCLLLLNKLDCLTEPTKRSGFGGKRGTFKNLKKIFVNSYNTRMG